MSGDPFMTEPPPSAETEQEKLPRAFMAQYDGECTWPHCWGFGRGDAIRADGEGGWECAEHRTGGLCVDR